MTDVIAPLRAARDVLRGAVERLEVDGHHAELQATDQTLGGARGLRLRASLSDGTEHTLSVVVGIDALQHVAVHIDGRLDPTIGLTLFPLLSTDLADVVRRAADHFVDDVCSCS